MKCCVEHELSACEVNCALGMERLPLDDPSLNLEFLCDFCHCKLNISTIFCHSHLFSSIHTAAAQPASHHITFTSHSLHIHITFTAQHHDNAGMSPPNHTLRRRALRLPRSGGDTR